MSKTNFCNAKVTAFEYNETHSVISTRHFVLFIYRLRFRGLRNDICYFNYIKNSDLADCSLLEVSWEISIVDPTKCEEIFSVTFNVIDDEAVAVSNEHIVSMHHRLYKILTS